MLRPGINLNRTDLYFRIQPKGNVTSVNKQNRIPRRHGAHFRENADPKIANDAFFSNYRNPHFPCSQIVVGNLLIGKFRYLFCLFFRLNTRRGSEARRRPPRHWVDELTVSSVGSNYDQQEAEQTAAAEQTTQGQGQEKQVEKVTHGEDENANLDNGVDMKTGENGEIINSDALPNGENLILTLQELQEKELTLPEFKCPSSEEKSREYAIREWLKHTSFSIGDRNVPLL
jgi:hypothetical protein